MIPYKCMGLFGVLEDFPEKYQSLDDRFVRNRSATFFFEAEGSAMEPTIFSGEVLIVDRSISKTDSRVCIVAYQDTLLCRRIRRQGAGLWLVADNPQHKSIEVFQPSDLTIWGVVISKAADVV